MSEVTKPMALDETLQDVADALDNLTEGYAGESAYESAVSGGYTMPQSQFEADTQAVRWRSNPNLLDNWYFVGGGDQQGAGQFPINQRKQTSYSGAVKGIDRWEGVVGSTTVTMLTNGINIQRSGIAGRTLQQPLESGLVRSLAGKTVTLSGMASGYNRLMLRCDSSLIADTGDSAANSQLVSATVQIPAEAQAIECAISAYLTQNQYVTAVKLELGDTQTLAHLENGVWILNEIPDYTTQLLRCQRFYRVFTSTSASTTGYGYSTNPKNLRPEMRATPSTGSFTYDGTTYYYLDANL